jgi:pyridoxamine 5'-phosphate oxidase
VDERDLDPDPLRQFGAWLAETEAADVPQPEAMALATVAPDGTPSVRMVLLRGADERGFAFFTNTESRKARELLADPRAALVFYWQPLGRQVRIEGRVEALERDEVEAYWRTRPRGSRIAARSSKQSKPIENRAALEARFVAEAAAYPGETVPLPPFWGGFRVVPDAIELWEHRDDRLHDRVRYERDGNGWRRMRLQP